MTKTQHSKETLVKKTIALAATSDWAHLTLSDIADGCGISLAELHGYFDDKADILSAFGRMIDKKILGEAEKPSPETPDKEILFDILMDRFDALNAYRAGLLSILNSFRLDPKQAVISMPHLCRSMTWMLEAAGIDTTGLRGAVRVAGLTGVYLKTLRVWMQDDSADLSKTMAALDKDLSRGENFLNSIGI